MALVHFLTDRVGTGDPPRTNYVITDWPKWRTWWIRNGEAQASAGFSTRMLEYARERGVRARDDRR